MARDTQIGDGKHLLKPSASNGRVVVGIPRQLAAAAGIDGSMFVGAMVVGKCLVIAPVSHVESPEAAIEDLRRIFDLAAAEWQKGAANRG